MEVEDASSRFVAEATRAPGSVVLCAMEGSRPLLVEVQALVAPTELVPPRRVANGVDRNRLALVLAVLARHAGLRLGSSDVFVSVAGGVRVDEPGADLAIALALASAAHGASLAAARPLAAFGELGLTASCATRPTPTAAWPRPRKFGLDAVLHPSPALATLAAALGGGSARSRQHPAARIGAQNATLKAAKRRKCARRVRVQFTGHAVRRG